MIHALARLVSPTGRLGIASVFLHRDARPRAELQARRDLSIPWADYSARTSRSRWNENEQYNVHLRYLIIAGSVKPSIIVHRLPLADAPMLPAL